MQPDWVGPEGLDLGAATLCGPDLVPPLLRTSGAHQREGGTGHRLLIVNVCQGRDWRSETSGEWPPSPKSPCSRFLSFYYSLERQEK